jgi:hypothetical protein
MFHKALLSFTSFLLFSLMSSNTALAFASDEFRNNSITRGDLILRDNGRTGMSRSDRVNPFDPINRRMYQKVIVGATQRYFNPLANYTHWRYITLYNVTQREERVAYLPYFEEGCHDDSFFMAEWGESRTIEVSLSSKVGAEALGLSASVAMSITQGSTFSTSRRINATEGIEAKHYPYKLSDTHTGVTYMQTYNSRTNTYGWLTPNIMRPSAVYPYPFTLNNQNIGFKVKRVITSRCPGYVSGSNSNDQGNALFR